MKIFEEILEHGYSVRKVEEIVKSLSEGESREERRTQDCSQTSQTARRIQYAETTALGFFSTKVQLTCSEKGKGKISIPFNNEEELERIIGILDTLKNK